MPVELIKRRFTADEYQRMGQAGILSEDDRVELIDGEVVAMTPIGPRHNAAVNRANRAMMTAVGDTAIVQVRGSVRLRPLSRAPARPGAAPTPGGLLRLPAARPGRYFSCRRNRRILDRLRPGGQGTSLRRIWRPGVLAGRPQRQPGVRLLDTRKRLLSAPSALSPRPVSRAARAPGLRHGG